MAACFSREVITAIAAISPELTNHMFSINVTTNHVRHLKHTDKDTGEDFFEEETTQIIRDNKFLKTVVAYPTTENDQIIQALLRFNNDANSAIFL